MNGKFIYAFSEDDAKKLIEAGFCLLKETDNCCGHTYIFANDEETAKKAASFALGSLERSTTSDVIAF